MNEQAKNLALSARRNSLILRKGCNLSWALQHKLSICLLKIIFLSSFIPSRITLSLKSINSEFITIYAYNKFFDLSP